jgi:hypothetical protein
MLGKIFFISSSSFDVFIIDIALKAAAFFVFLYIIIIFTIIYYDLKFAKIYKSYPVDLYH